MGSTEEQGRAEGVGFADGDEVYFVPAERLGEFRVEGDDAEGLRDRLTTDEVSGYGTRSFRQLDGIFQGPIGPRGSKAWNGELLEYSPPPPPPAG